MAGGSDPLEDMFFSEVDEKAVSDLVGSLESELTGQSNPAAPHTEIRSTAAAGAANHHLGRMLPVQVGTILQQQEEGQHKAVLNQEPSSKALSSGKTVIPSSLSSIPPFPTIALQRPPPSHITNIAQNGNGTATSTLIQSGTRAGTPAAAGTQLVNHKSADASSIPKTDSPAQSKIIMSTQPCVVNSLMNPTTSAPVMNPPTSQPHSSIANSVPAVSSPVPLNTVAKPASVNIVGPPLGAPVGVVRPGTPSPSQVLPTPAHPQQPRPGVGAPQQRLVAPQLIVRPPQQTTIQLPPGFTIPQGELVML
ncbi:UNVERIFIED_CONTAM: hypothetical protein FKN15_061546 [Acipenser sinensis]